jgi:FMN phosphatase YigB (HAD superfamily)
MPPIRAIIFDMGDVLFTWNPIADTTITPQQIRTITSGPLWHDFERGLLTEIECYKLRGEALGLSPAEITATFHQTTASLTPDPTMTDLVRDLKGYGLKVYMMTNIPRGDFDVLRRVEYVWELFDGVFASGYVGMRKPDRCFYELLLEELAKEVLCLWMIRWKMWRRRGLVGWLGCIFGGLRVVLRRFGGLLGLGLRVEGVRVFVWSTGV